LVLSSPKRRRPIRSISKSGKEGKGWDERKERETTKKEGEKKRCSVEKNTRRS